MSDEVLDAITLWLSFKHEVLYRNRFIVNHKVLEHLEHMAQNNTQQIDEGTILYRARIFNDDDLFLKYLDCEISDVGLDVADQLINARYKYDIESRKKSGFWGFNSEDSFIPPVNDSVNDGRTNPAFIKYLYTAEDPYTALVEVRPYLKSKVSVAEVKVNKPIKIADFSYAAFEHFEGLEQTLIYLIMRDFSIPSNSNQKDYIPTQYVAEYIKTLGLDGIKFNSSLHGRGRNITIFNYETCSAIGSKLYEVEDICYEAKGLAPKNEKDLAHWKLQPYKEKSQRELFLKLKPKE